MLFSNCVKKVSRDFFRTIELVENPASATRIDKALEADAAKSGLSQDNVDTIWKSIENLFTTGTYPGISFCLRRSGRVVLNRSIGYSRGIDPEEGLSAPVLMQPETPVSLYSASKAVMAMLVHKAIEEGHLNLLDPISHYIPEFGINGKKDISIYQMLTHRGGFPTIEGSDPELIYDREAALDAIYNTEAICEEGRIQAYHAITSGFIADELIRRTAGVSIEEYLKEKFARPMGMKYFTFGLDKKYQDEVAINYVTGMRNGRIIDGILKKALGVSPEEAAELSNDESFYTAVIPSVNLFSTAEEVNRFYQMLLDRGEYQGQEILKPTTIKIATREASSLKFDASLKLPIRFSPGFMLGGKPVGMYGLNTHHAYGHIGFSNILCWADPERDISVSILNTGKPILGNHLLALMKAVHTISSQCARCENIAGD
ncbi:MAG: beta-lactamase family protein [Proteobacteria bacterium]|nr:beta-lactamase family protein [Pseudomonadota bacterium]